jgi:hypothetical protein
VIATAVDEANSALWNAVEAKKESEQPPPHEVYYELVQTERGLDLRPYPVVDNTNKAHGRKRDRDAGEDDGERPQMLLSPPPGLTKSRRKKWRRAEREFMKAQEQEAESAQQQLVLWNNPAQTHTHMPTEQALRRKKRTKHEEHARQDATEFWGEMAKERKDAGDEMGAREAERNYKSQFGDGQVKEEEEEMARRETELLDKRENEVGFEEEGNDGCYEDYEGHFEETGGWDLEENWAGFSPSPRPRKTRYRTPSVV